jgi:CRISPR-associated exonuclease Cas4
LLLLAIVALLIGSGLALWWARRERRRASLPAGRIVYADTGDWRQPEQPLYSHHYRLTGKPDYLIDTPDGIVPVEVKSGHTPVQPHDSHVLQLTAYCLLVEDTAGRRPSHGLIRYPDATFSVAYTPALRDRLIRTLAAMRADLQRADAPSGQAGSQRCAGCGYGEACGEYAG